MNIARMIVLGVAVLAAGLAAFLVRSMSTSQGPAVAALEAGAVLNTSEVLVASRPITVGETMTANEFRWQAWPEEATHASFIVRKGAGDSASNWIGAVMRAPVVAGEPLTAQKMVKIGEGGTMAAILEPGMRGVGVKISAETGAGGFILPNDRVDVLVTYREKSKTGGDEVFRSDTILKAVRVLAIDQTFSEQDGQKVVVGRTATLELTPLQTEDLALASRVGSISLTLRSLASKGDAEDEDPLARKRKTDGSQILVLRNGRPSGS